MEEDITTTNLTTTAGATVSACGTYRYHLWRSWDENRPHLTFLMLNPSTADALSDDPTLRRISKISREFGYGGVDVLNLYAFRSPHPSILAKAKSPHGPHQTHYLSQQIIKLQNTQTPLVLAWGNHAKTADTQDILHRLTQAEITLTTLGLTKQHQPMHPLFSPTPPKLYPYQPPSSQI